MEYIGLPTGLQARDYTEIAMRRMPQRLIADFVELMQYATRRQYSNPFAPWTSIVQKVFLPKITPNEILP
jgi:hypothetical protein